MNKNGWVRVSKKSAKMYRQRAIKLLKDVQNELRNKFKFNFKLVGSGLWNIIIKNKDGFFNLDYQIILTKNSKVDLSDASHIKNEFFYAFKKYVKNTEKVENSKTAITLIDNVGKFSIDFVIIKILFEKSFIIRRKNENYKNLFVWDELPSSSADLYTFFNSLPSCEKQIIIEKMVIPEKIIEKNKDQNAHDSYEILLSKINEYKVSQKK